MKEKNLTTELSAALDTLSRAVFSQPLDQSADAKISVRPLLHRGTRIFQLERQRGAQVFHQNLEGEALLRMAADELDGRYRQALIVTEEASAQYSLRQNGLYKKTGCAAVPRPAGTQSHNREKQYLLREGEALGPYRLLAADVEVGEAVLLSGTNSFTVPLSYAAGQATNLVPSAREPFATVFRADTPTGASAPAPATMADDAADAGIRLSASGVRQSEEPLPADPPERAAVSATLTREEEADLRRRATVRGEDGAEHLSFRELQRLRAALLAEKAEAARAAALAEAEERRAEAAAKRAAENAAKKAAEDEAKAAAAEKERLRRAAVVQALAQGYDVEVDFTLTAEEAQQLRDAGYDVPDAVLEGRATLGGADSAADDDGEDEE